MTAGHRGGTASEASFWKIDFKVQVEAVGGSKVSSVAAECGLPPSVHLVDPASSSAATLTTW